MTVKPLDECDIITIPEQSLVHPYVRMDRLKELFKALKEDFKTVRYMTSENGQMVECGCHMSRHWKKIQERFGPLIEDREDNCRGR